MFKISPYTPLFFSPSDDRSTAKSRYVQVFAPSDVILIEIIDPDHSYWSHPVVTNLITGEKIDLFDKQWPMNEKVILYWYEVSGLSESFYKITIGDMESEVFRITTDIKDTMLIQYSMNTNTRNTDGVFFIDGMQHFFDFRITGGFKDSEWVFGVDNEQYNTSDNDILDVYAVDNLQKTLTVGNAKGCPIWFGEMLNRILCCTYVYINGERYCRKDSNVPEISIINDRVNSFIFKQLLQKVRNYNPTIETNNQVILRRVDGDKIRITPSNINNIRRV